MNRHEQTDRQTDRQTQYRQADRFKQMIVKTLPASLSPVCYVWTCAQVFSYNYVTTFVRFDVQYKIEQGCIRRLDVITTKKPSAAEISFVTQDGRFWNKTIENKTRSSRDQLLAGANLTVAYSGFQSIHVNFKYYGRYSFYRQWRLNFLKTNSEWHYIKLWCLIKYNTNSHIARLP